MIDENIAKPGFGLMRLPLIKNDDWSTINHELAEKLVDLFMEKGFSCMLPAATPSKSQALFSARLTFICFLRYICC